MRILLANKDNAITETSDLEMMKSMLNNQENLIWVDLDRDPANESRKILTEIFGFHPLSVDDALVEVHVPKIDDWGNYLYLALIAIDPEQRLDDFEKTIELDIFIGNNYIVTYHQEELRSTDLVWDNSLRNGFSQQHSSRSILYQIIDELANEYMKMIDNLDMDVEEIENTVIEKPDKNLLEKIFSIKRSLLNMRRIIAPQREVLNRLARGDYGIITQQERMYFRDVYDHLVRVHEIIESLRDMVGGVLDTYLSVVNNQLSSIMKTLTIITTLFMPLSFLTGFFGMNFFAASNQLDQWTGAVSFTAVLAVMIGLPLGMYLWMRRRDWM
jgi:magnesium transporter